MLQRKGPSVRRSSMEDFTSRMSRDRARNDGGYRADSCPCDPRSRPLEPDAIHLAQTCRPRAVPSATACPEIASSRVRDILPRPPGLAIELADGAVLISRFSRRSLHCCAGTSWALLFWRW
ncbi:hypothetical protein CN138_09840 [Sinorhizobium meliloti]|uniref:Uncharacterized protein n=1 Tax=Rhizobium meliloti (strain 1021) TaxID=266834 RepID=Q92Z44_RHIME|nr:hypothetical protein SMa1197 [Sinorhizobium meliloti 1021]AGG70339.1 Hypothetical protein SM2011_a1197 [Sinorhizobium meliloti 2011]ASP60277.1 hypothetical protein CDO30_18145 [Sinorhizobium meliloti]QGJ76942.1 hypothetical protein C3L21_24135 [Sinorhizobium meliloti]RVE95352.1 hypothetical protein CN235_11070 [Sinorhizobium meliloti]